MSDITTTVDRYIALWNETSHEARMTAIAEVFTAEAIYTDPLADVAGYDGIDAVVAGAQAQFPGYAFKLLDAVDSNHNIARFTWELVPAAGGESLVIGADVAVFGEDGKIRSVYGFLNKVPSA
jgi:hypothetical protein